MPAQPSSSVPDGPLFTSSDVVFRQRLRSASSHKLRTVHAEPVARYGPYYAIGSARTAVGCFLLLNVLYKFTFDIFDSVVCLNTFFDSSEICHQRDFLVQSRNFFLFIWMSAEIVKQIGYGV